MHPFHTLIYSYEKNDPFVTLLLDNMYMGPWNNHGMGLVEDQFIVD